jgi:hypothetical protein
VDASSRPGHVCFTCLEIRLLGHVIFMYNTRKSVQDSAHIVLAFFSSVENDYIGVMVVPLLLGMYVISVQNTHQDLKNVSQGRIFAVYLLWTQRWWLFRVPLRSIRVRLIAHLAPPASPFVTNDSGIFVDFCFMLPAALLSPLYSKAKKRVLGTARPHRQLQLSWDVGRQLSPIRGPKTSAFLATVNVHALSKCR